MSEPTDPQAPPAPDPELIRRRQETQLEVWQARQHAEVEIQRARADAELAAAVKSGLYERLAWARAVAQSDLVPAGFRARRKPDGSFYDGEVDKAAASIVLAQEWGEAIGLGGMKALMHLQVIEGNIGVKPASARGLMAGRGVIIGDTWSYSESGEPIKCVTTALRPGRDEPDEAEYTIEDAVRDRLCTVERDEHGQVTGVRARGGVNKDKVLPWEKRTKDMLMWRATSRIVRAHYQDMVGGMDFTTDFEPETEEAPTPPPMSETLSGTLQRVASERADRNGGGYDPTADLALFGENDPWWNYSGAQVTRRSRKQMAADRLSAAMQGGDSRVPPPPTGDGLPETMTRPVDFDDSPEEGRDLRTGVVNDPFARMGSDLADPEQAAAFDREMRTPYEPETLPDIDPEIAGPPGGNPLSHPGFDPNDESTWPQPDENWTPNAPPAPETKEQLLARLGEVIESLGRPREAVLERFYILRGGRIEEDWTEDEIRDTIAALNR